MAQVRQMDSDDIIDCAHLFNAALDALRKALAMEPMVHDDEATQQRIRHLLATDAPGSWVASEDGRLVGFTQAQVRQDCWILAHLFIDPALQSKGIGTQLLAQATTHGFDVPVGLIGATADPKAIRQYVRLPGFRAYPTLAAYGTIDRSKLDESFGHEVVEGTARELAATFEIDSKVRRGAHGSDLLLLIDLGHRLLLIPERGYALVTNETIGLLAATDEDAAKQLLVAGLSQISSGVFVSLPRMTAEQQWAVPILVDSGLALRPWGPFVIRGLNQPPHPYLPHPVLC